VDEQRRRVSTAWAYLGPEIRRRPNLEIRTDATVSRILFAQGRADRALVMKGGTQEEIKARHIILSTGALATPAILMRSGIGPAPHLADCGIEVLLDLPGVAKPDGASVGWSCAIPAHGATAGLTRTTSLSATVFPLS
jgi:5-(hydroxymethyl)furfural/furfural oxidase